MEDEDYSSEEDLSTSSQASDDMDVVSDDMGVVSEDDATFQQQYDSLDYEEVQSAFDESGLVEEALIPHYKSVIENEDNNKDTTNNIIEAPKVCFCAWINIYICMPVCMSMYWIIF